MNITMGKLVTERLLLTNHNNWTRPGGMLTNGVYLTGIPCRDQYIQLMMRKDLDV